MTTAKKSASAKVSNTSPKQPSLTHRLDTLLHTVRCIAQYEDALCELSHEAKRSNTLTSTALGELRGILEKIPATDYLHELDAVAEVLAGAPAARRSVPGAKSGNVSARKKARKKLSKQK